ncbi:RNA-dependent RNA polymerase [viral metagenome]|uniref:RNA-dependent RNA polymerase n=1 Tax=viral metagenome TaxID=1070528 RepID=A0A6L2ZKX6_9ZZZZ
MPNLLFLQRVPKHIMPWRFEFKLPKEVTEHRKDIVIRAMNMYYSQDEIAQVLTNRRSDFSDQAVIEDFLSTEHDYHPIPKDDHFNSAVEQTRILFQPSETLYPIAFPDLRYYPWNLPPSAEAPWNLNSFTFTPLEGEKDWNDPIWSNVKPKATKLWKTREWLRYKQRLGLIDDDSPNFHNLYNELFGYNRHLVHKIKYGSKQFWTSDGTPIPYYWNTLHSRSHVVSQDEPDKIRAVFGATKLLLMVENMFIWQLQRVYLNNDDGRLLWGREIMKGGWRKLSREIHEHGTPNTILSIDWSQFDKRLLFQIIVIVHAIFRSYFDFTRYAPTSFYPQGKPKSPHHIERLWKWMTHSIMFTPILLPDGRLYQWQWNGFGSGYQQTQLMDTFANSIMILTCLSSLGINIKSEHFWIRIQGDDSLVSFFERVFDIFGPLLLVQLAAAAQYYFNAKLNVKKSQALRQLSGVTVLGYLNYYGLPFRTDEDLLRHLYFPERDQDWTRLAASAMGLAMAATGCSKRFHKTCEWIWNYLVIKRNVVPRFSALRWMERSNMIERAESLYGVPFPNRLNLRAEAWNNPTRTDSQQQRLWPTRPGPAGRFYFL